MKFDGWLMRLQTAFRIYNLTKAITKRNYLLHYLGAEGLDI